MNYAIVYLAGILAFALIYWFIRGRKVYTGPLVEADIHEDGSQEGRSSDEQQYKTKEEY